MRGKIINLTAGLALAVLVGGHSAAADAAEFSFSFEWGNIPSCTSGSPNTVPNPIFGFSGVPTGTKKIKMHLLDVNVGYDHDGGIIPYAGENVIQPGVFEYASPCPPNGAHTYEWTALAVDGDGKTIAEARASKDYDGW